MFYSLTGNVIFTDLNSVALECGGVGFRCLTSTNTLRDVDVHEKTTLYTHLNVREDALDLFGFSTEYELEWFKLLIGVTGVGPKAALAILSELSPDKLALAVSAGDVKAITRAQGVGPKIAQRVILELKDKAKSALSSFGEVSSQADDVAEVFGSSNTSEAVAALTMLGYSQSEAALAVSKVDASLPTDQIIKQCLKLLSRQV
ncbi:MAG: Holliday junction branch migration protein RuvA [Oscillospiraceae bacterium]|nr:Holliday junction branch migration protein RuvA [Oscillospiraceae bacterium]